jgi:hypothetical protein
MLRATVSMASRSVGPRRVSPRTEKPVCSINAGRPARTLLALHIGALRLDLLVFEDVHILEIQQGLVSRVAERHPDCPHLRWTRLRILATRASRLGDDCDPDTNELIRIPDKEGRREYKRARYRSLADQAASWGGWGVFGDLALELADNCYAKADELSARRKTQLELLSKYPHSPVVREMMDRGRILPDVLQDSRRSVK